MFSGAPVQRCSSARIRRTVQIGYRDDRTRCGVCLAGLKGPWALHKLAQTCTIIGLESVYPLVYMAPGRGGGRARNDRGGAGSGSQVNGVGIGMSHRGDPCWGCRPQSKKRHVFSAVLIGVVISIAGLVVDHAEIQVGEPGDGCHVGKDRPQRPESDRLGFGEFGERGDLIGRPGGTLDHPADGPIEGAAAARLDRAADGGIVGPREGRPHGHFVLARPRGDEFALRDRDGELDFFAIGKLFGYRTGAGFSCRGGVVRASHRRAGLSVVSGVVRALALSRGGKMPPRLLFGPDRGSQPGAQAGRHALEGQGS